MRYEIAIKLKEAGFPEPKVRNESQTYLTKGLMSNGEMQDIPFGAYDLDTLDREFPFAYVPTLLDLIEACGDRFGRLERVKMPSGIVLYAATESYPQTIPTTQGVDSPEEAVAELWLKTR